MEPKTSGTPNRGEEYAYARTRRHPRWPRSKRTTSSPSHAQPRRRGGPPEAIGVATIISIIRNHFGSPARSGREPLKPRRAAAARGRMRTASARSAGPALSAGPAAETGRPTRRGGVAARTARAAAASAAASAASAAASPAAAAASAAASPNDTVARARPNDTVARARYLARQPPPVVYDAARTGEWQPAMHWKLGSLRQAVQGAEVADSSVGRLAMHHHGPPMLEWLETVVMQPEVPWRLEQSQAVARAYGHTLLVQKLSAAPASWANVLANMRDVLVVGAILRAQGRHDSADDITSALTEIFGRSLDKVLYGQMQHSYHRVLHNINRAYQSKCKRGRVRPARPPRRHAGESATDGATEGEEEGATGGETEADEAADESDFFFAGSSESPPAHGSIAAVVRQMMTTAGERVQKALHSIWKALREQGAIQRRGQEALQQLEVKVRTMHAEMEGYKARVAHLEAILLGGAVLSDEELVGAGTVARNFAFVLADEDDGEPSSSQLVTAWHSPPGLGGRRRRGSGGTRRDSRTQG